MRVEIILQHGWGFDSRVWNSWIPQLCALTRTVIVHTGERGYYGAPALAPTFVDSKSYKVVVAHSLGFHLLRPEVLAEANAIYLLAGFLSFHPEDQLSNKRSKRITRAMREKLCQNPNAVLRDFLKLCYASNKDLSNRENAVPLCTVASEEFVDKQRLLEDLDILDHNDLLSEAATIKEDATLCLFHGTADRVVSPDKSIEIATVLHNAKLVLLENATHALPTTHSALCVETLKNSLINKLETRYVNLSQ
jgi:pimeloyl-[acyl-carrier protein] methyl ester esterase